MSPKAHTSGANLIGLDLSGGSLKIVSMNISSGKTELSNLFTAGIADLDDSQISKIIRESYSKLKLRDPYVISTIPSHAIITKNIEIPSTNPKEIQEIINLQASRYTPYSREEIMVDYIEIATFKNNYTKILLIIVGRNVIKRQFEILGKAGIRLEKVVLIPEGLAWSLPKMLRLDTITLPVNVIHIDETSSDFIIVYRNRPIFIRSISIGSRQLIQEKNAYEPKFIEEIKKSYEVYQNEDIEKLPRSLVVTGAVDELEGLEAALNSTLHIQSKVVSCMKQISLTKEAAEKISKVKQISFFSVVSSLLARDEVKVDLIPEEVKLRREIEERGKDLIKTGVFLLAIFVLVFSIMISKIYFKNTYLQILNGKYEKLYTEAQRLEKQFERVTMIRDYLSKRGRSIEVLGELHDAVPMELELNDIRFEQGAKFVVKGTARSMSVVFAFVDSMEKSEYFGDVKTRYTTKRREGKRDVTDFEINCILNVEQE